MKTLYLTRHAKSSWKEPMLQDKDRPLNKRGKKNSKMMALLLKEKSEIPEVLISSPAKRALSTARRFAKTFGSQKEDIIKAKELYMGWNTNFINVISGVDKDKSSVMLFSHNPGITEFVNYISDAQIDNVPTCGVVKISFDTDTWDKINDNKGKLIFFEYPKKYAEEV